MLSGKRIVLGVTGGIAAYKSCEAVSRLKKLGATVCVIMTKNATEFVAPMTFETLSNQPCVVDTFARPERWEVEHVSLAKRADLFVIAPATANIMAKLAHGIADDMLSTTCLATRAPMLIAPAMNTGLWENVATQENLKILQARGMHFVGPEGGYLACGDVGAGNTTKLANQIIVACNIQAVAEAFTLAQKAGVDPEVVYRAIRGGLAGSTVMDAKGPMMIAGNDKPGFKIDLHIKDLNNALDCAHAVGAPVPMTASVQEILQWLHNNDCGGNDHSAIAKYYERLTGIKIGR